MFFLLFLAHKSKTKIMKSKYVTLVSALLISVATFAQKDQIKAPEKALKGGNAQEAVTILQGAESLISSAADAEKAQYFFVKGNAYLELANKKVEEEKSFFGCQILPRFLAQKNYREKQIFFSEILGFFCIGSTGN